jgi:hypothetical protein
LGRLRGVPAHTRDLCLRRAVDLVVIPAKLRLCRNQCVFPGDSACREWRVDGLAGALGAAEGAVSPDTGDLDVTARRYAEASGSALLYLPDDPHWSAEGHRAAASALADYLRSRPDAADVASASARAGLQHFDDVSCD